MVRSLILERGAEGVGEKSPAREQILEKNQVRIFGRKSMNFLLVS